MIKTICKIVYANILSRAIQRNKYIVKYEYINKSLLKSKKCINSDILLPFINLEQK